MGKESVKRFDKIIYKEESFLIQGAIFQVYKEKGCGFLESVYHECLEKEFALQGIPFSSKRKIQLFYKGEPLEQSYEPDLICFDKIIVELKAVKNIAPEHKAQLLNYLKVTDYKLGIPVSFGHYPQAEIKRIVL